MNVSRGRHEPLTVTWEIEIAEGEDAEDEDGEALARHQAQAVLEVLAWIVEQRRQEDSPAASDTS
ncbi:hypothetical protein GCM10023080_061540 [Streptomyces pseudoechinosporeus]